MGLLCWDHSSTCRVLCVGQMREYFMQSAPVWPSFTGSCTLGYDAVESTTCQRISVTKMRASKFDDTGISALVSLHDTGTPLFTGNVDTPGNRQKYPFTLVEAFYSYFRTDQLWYSMILAVLHIGVIVE